jgi:hypothetical protein
MVQIRFTSNTLVGFAKQHLLEQKVLPSALQFFQHCPQPQALEWLLSMVPEVQDDRAVIASLLRAIAAQEGPIAAKRLALDRFLTSVLRGAHGNDACLAGLALLTRRALWHSKVLRSRKRRRR